MSLRPCSSVLTVSRSASIQRERPMNLLRSSPLRYTMLRTAPKPTKAPQIHNHLATSHKIIAMLALALS